MSNDIQMSGAPRVEVRVNGRAVSVPVGTVAAAAIAMAGVTAFRSSVRGQPRGPICGMGICMECRATVNGQPLRRTCLMVCEQGMEINTEVTASIASAVAA
jgi:aerobic-type carbon monoxide dehydrogenase small subunit (CoxS/CutS family)